MPKSNKQVGYKKPPKDKQFKPGQSGNSKGRPNGSKNRKSMLDTILDEEVSMHRENGELLTLNKAEALLRLGFDQAPKDFRYYKWFADYIKERAMRSEKIDALEKENHELKEKIAAFEKANDPQQKTLTYSDDSLKRMAEIFDHANKERLKHCAHDHMTSHHKFLLSNDWAMNATKYNEGYEHGKRETLQRLQNHQS